MKKTIFTAIMLLVCFAVSANAATNFKIDITAINEEATPSDSVIYTTQFGDSIITDEINAVHGFGDFYVVAIVPKDADGDVSENTSSDLNSAEENYSETVSEEISFSEDADNSEMSDIEEPYLSNESSAISESGVLSGESDNNRQTGLKSFFGKNKNEKGSESPSEESSESALKSNGTTSRIYKARENNTVYSVKEVYSPGTENKDVTIPENGFVLAFPGSTVLVSGDKIISGKNISVGDTVRIYGVDIANSTAIEGAYVEIQLSDKDMMEDIPQTGDRGAMVFFCIVGVAAAFVAVGAYKKMKREGKSL